MVKAVKYRLNPTNKQKTLFAQTFGCCRVVWNNYVSVFYNNLDAHFLETDYGVDLPEDYKKDYKSIKDLRNDPDLPYLKDVSSGALNYKVQHFMQYKKDFFDKKKDVGFPKFKSRKSRQSYSLQYPRFKFNNNYIRLEKVGWVKFVNSQSIPDNARFISCTISKNCAQQYFVSVTFETQQPKPLPKTGKAVGIDLGIKEFVVTSDGKEIHNPHYQRDNQAKIIRLQKIQSKKVGSKKNEHKSCRWWRLQSRINRCYNDIVNSRNDFLHKITTELVREYDTICIEDLNVSGMMQNHKLAGSIADVGWYEFRRMLTYKWQWYGKELVVINRFTRTTNKCSGCGHELEEKLTLSDRVFVCPNCGLSEGRDYNAAMNILQVGIGDVHVNQTQRGEVAIPDEAFSELVTVTSC